MINIPEVVDLKNALEKGEQIRCVYVAGGDDGMHEGIVDVMIADCKAKEGSVAVVRLDAPPPKPSTTKKKEKTDKTDRTGGADGAEDSDESGDGRTRDSNKPDIWDEIWLIAAEVPMFGGATVVVVSGCGAGSAKLPDKVKETLAKPPAHLRVVMYGDRKTTNSSLAKTVAENGRVIGAKDVKDGQAMTAAVSAGRQLGLMLDGRVASALVDLVGTDRSSIESAVRVLAEYAGPAGRIGVADLPGLVQRTRKSAPWDFDDAIGNRDLPLATKLAVRELQDAKEPRGRAIAMFNGILRQVRKMLAAKAMLARGEDRKIAMKNLSINWDFMWDRLIRSSKHYSQTELEAFLLLAPALEIRVKRGHGGPSTQILDVLMTLMTRRTNQDRR